METFYNTVNEKGDSLLRCTLKAKTLDQAVLVILKEFSEQTFAPHEVQQMLRSKPLLTSVRRSLSTLTKSGLVCKTTEKRMGPYGRKSYTWRIA